MRKTIKIWIWGLISILSFTSVHAEPTLLWKLDKSEITYTVTHPLHVVRGVSHSARGKGLRGSDGAWQFLVGVPVKTFDSGDTNRDLHMQEVTQAGLYPMVTVQARIGKMQEGLSPQILKADLDINFAGQKAHYGQVPLQVLDWKEGRVHLVGTIPITLKDFHIPPPSLLTLSVSNEVPVKWEMWWSKSENSQ